MWSLVICTVPVVACTRGLTPSLPALINLCSFHAKEPHPSMDEKWCQQETEDPYEPPQRGGSWGSSVSCLWIAFSYSQQSTGQRKTDTAHNSYSVTPKVWKPSHSITPHSESPGLNIPLISYIVCYGAQLSGTHIWHNLNERTTLHPLCARSHLYCLHHRWLRAQRSPTVPVHLIKHQLTKLNLIGKLINPKTSKG